MNFNNSNDKLIRNEFKFKHVKKLIFVFSMNKIIKKILD